MTKDFGIRLESRLIDCKSQNMTFAARTTAESKVLAHVSWPISTPRQAFRLPKTISIRLRR